MTLRDAGEAIEPPAGAVGGSGHGRREIGHGGTAGHGEPAVAGVSGALTTSAVSSAPVPSPQANCNSGSAPASAISAARPTLVCSAEDTTQGSPQASATASARRTPPSGAHLSTATSAAPATATRSGSSARRMDSSAAIRHRDPAAYRGQLGQLGARLFDVLQPAGRAVQGPDRGHRLVDRPAPVGVHPDGAARPERVPDRGHPLEVGGAATRRVGHLDLGRAAARRRRRAPAPAPATPPARCSSPEPVRAPARANRAGGLPGGGQPRTGLGVVVLGERAELPPPGRPVEQQALAHGDPRNRWSAGSRRRRAAPGQPKRTNPRAAQSSAMSTTAPRLLQVRRSERITPRMVRVTLAGDALAGFGGDGPDRRIKMFFPAPGQDRPAVPRATSGGPVWPAGGHARPCAPTRCAGSIRTAGELDVDFVLHDGHGPAAAWARDARPGCWVGVSEPGGRYLPDPGADFHIVIGDESALPGGGHGAGRVAGRRADHSRSSRSPTPRRSSGCPAEPPCTGCTARPGRPGSRWSEAVRTATFPPGAGRPGWPGSRRRWKELRGHLLTERGLDRRSVYATGYWRAR